jgi:hypothetical protein
MPTYSIKDPQTGKTLRITGDSPPTEKELDEIFASAAPANTPVSTVPERPDSPVMRSMDPFAQMGRQMASPQGQEAMATTFQTVKNLGLEGGGATAGQAAGAPFAPVTFGASVPVGGAIGGFLGNTAAQLTTPGKSYSFGEALGAGAAGAVPGASLAKAGVKTVAAQAGKNVLGNVAAVNAESLAEGRGFASLGEDLTAAGSAAIAAPLSKYIDTGKRATASANRAAQDSVRRETLNAGRQLGLVVPPSAVAPGVANDTLQSIAGKAATAQAAIERNQPKINAAIRADIGLPDNAPLSEVAINTQRVAPNLVYDRIAKFSDEANNLLGKFKQSNDQARELFDAYNTSKMQGLPNNTLLRDARMAAGWADAFKENLKKVVPKDLYDEFEASRIRLAKIGLAERAINLGDGNIDPKVYGRALDDGEKLTGNARTIGRFSNAFERYMKEAAKSPPSGVDYLKYTAKLGAGAGGYAAGGLPLAIAAPLAMAGAERGSRSLLLSPFYQKRFAQPYYGPTSEDISAGLARLGTMSAGREEN